MRAEPPASSAAESSWVAQTAQRFGAQRHGIFFQAARPTCAPSRLHQEQSNLRSSTRLQAVWSAATWDLRPSGKADSRAEPPASGQSNLTHRQDCISGLERSDIGSFPGRRGRLARRAALHQGRAILRITKLHSGLERSDKNKRSPHISVGAGVFMKLQLVKITFPDIRRRARHRRPELSCLPERRRPVLRWSASEQRWKPRFAARCGSPW